MVVSAGFWCWPIRQSKITTVLRHPSYEKNNRKLEDILQDQNKKFSKPKNKYNSETKKQEPFSETEAASLTRAVSIYLKHAPDLYCIDVDDPTIPSLDVFIEKTGYEIFKDCLWSAGNTKGIHIYVWIKDMIKYTNQRDVYKNFKGDFMKTNNMWGKEGKVFNNFDKDLPTQPLAFDDIKTIFKLNELNKKQKKGYFEKHPSNRPIKKLYRDVSLSPLFFIYIILFIRRSKGK